MRRVLVVDDDRDSVNGLGMLLEADGHVVRTACDGATALDEAVRFRPELVILDLNLGDMSGYELAQELRSRLGGSAFLLALSGLDGEEVRDRCRAAGIDRHLAKPVVDFGAMRALVRSLDGRVES